MKYESASYDVLLKDGDYEIRRYHPMILAKTKERSLSGAYGFNEIFNYISKDNDKNQKISMTTPVINDLHQTSPISTAFVMPKAYTIDTLPTPNSSNTQLVTVKERVMAIVRFSQSVDPKRIFEQQQRLLEWIEKRNLKVISDFMLARYNPPFIPGFLKRNEIMVEIDQTNG